MRRIGLTGGIGSGKSTAARFLADRGAAVIDVDDISRSLTGEGGGALPALREAFGVALVPRDGALDRRAMRALAFTDAAARARLEAILHPRIREETRVRIAAATGPYAVIVVPLLFETGSWAGALEGIVVVDCSEALQVERTVARSGLAPEEVRRIMAAQWPRWRRLQAADAVLWNGGDAAALEAQCERLHARLCAGAAFP